MTETVETQKLRTCHCIIRLSLNSKRTREVRGWWWPSHQTQCYQSAQAKIQLVNMYLISSCHGPKFSLHIQNISMTFVMVLVSAMYYMFWMIPKVTGIPPLPLLIGLDPEKWVRVCEHIPNLGRQPLQLLTGLLVRILVCMFSQKSGPCNSHS
jgi:hypothetical protein